MAMISKAISKEHILFCFLEDTGDGALVGGVGEFCSVTSSFAPLGSGSETRPDSRTAGTAN